MAKTLFKIITIVFTIFFPIAQATSESRTEFKTMSKLVHKKLKQTQFSFYLHQIPDSTKDLNATEVKVARAPTTDTSPSSFGLVAVYDYPLTETLDINSKQVGRAQGIFQLSSTTLPVIEMAFTIVFTEGKFNGSSVSVLGRNAFATDKFREMPIVGGTGLLRFATGYIITSSIGDGTAVDNILSFKLYVYHY